MFLMPGDRPYRSRIRGRGGILQYNTYTSSQTIVIPKDATKAFVRLMGGGGGANTGGNNNIKVSAGGQAGYLEKLLTNLVPFNSLVLTIGAAGTVSGSPTGGGNSTLVAGTQPISTLTCNGGAAGGNNSVGSGGTATGGDLNVTGSNGAASQGNRTISCTPNVWGAFAGGNVGLFGASFGGGGAATVGGGCGTLSTAAAGPGVCIIIWFG